MGDSILTFVRSTHRIIPVRRRCSGLVYLTEDDSVEKHGFVWRGDCSASVFAVDVGPTSSQSHWFVNIMELLETILT